MAAIELADTARLCKNCGDVVARQRPNGRIPDHCSAACRKKSYLVKIKTNWAARPICREPGCANKVRGFQATQCGVHYRIDAKAKAGTCSIHKCNKPAIRVGHHLCEMHYGRIRRNGNIDERVIAGRYEVKSGYRKLLLPDHPLSEKAQGQLYEHRYVAYEARQGICTPCHWCGVELTWKTATIDHLNEVKLDNSPANLVTACNKCNRARGQFKSFIKRMTNEGFEAFIAQARAFRAT